MRNDVNPMDTPVDVDALPTAWREAGTGPIAIFLHGIGSSRTGWRPQFAELAELRRLIAWDAPGYGNSLPVAEPTFTAYAERVAELIAEISPGAPVDLVGMSFGGMIAQYVAATYPTHVRTLTLLCTSPKFGLDGTDPVTWRADRLAGLETAGSPAAAAPFILASLAGPRGAHVVPEAVESMSRIPMEGLLTALETIVTHDSRSILPSITAPTLVLVGAHDTETPPAYGQAIVDLVPGAKLQIVNGAGHLLNLEAPAEVNALVAQHWEKI
jgi:3-oxoadipate enol-lactonase